jgi:glutamyl-tRNA synthetase
MTNVVRVRFAPSPTGYLHIGGLRTALYNFLFAQKCGGTFILRIEDTDRTRYVEGALENLIATLGWAGLEYDEGPGKERGYGPYVQSERTGIYHQHIDQLLKEGKAYRCFCSPERLEEMRIVQQKRGIPPKYDRRCLEISEQEILGHLEKQTPCVIRMKMPEDTTVVVDDIVRGKVEFQSELIDDQVLLKSDGYPTYHLANVVDDHLMEVTHVIRGEEWLSSTPKHVILYGFFGWDLPKFAHLPLLLNRDRSKLSKRQGDVAVEEYRAKGYLPEALINFVALLGWGPTDDRNVFSISELIQQFSLERVGKSGSVFDVEKLDWLNKQHIRMMPEVEVVEMTKHVLEHKDYPVPPNEYLCRVVELMKDRVTVIDDFVTSSPYFYKDPTDYDQQYARRMWKSETTRYLEQLNLRISGVVEWSQKAIEALIRDYSVELNVGAGQLIHPLRLALTGVSVGPGLFELMEVLGKEIVQRRIRKGVELLK